MPAGSPVKRIPSIRSRLVVGLIGPLLLVAAVVSVETFVESRRLSNHLYDQTLLSVMLVISESVVAQEGDLLSEHILEALSENLGDQFFYHVAGPNDAYVSGYSGVPVPPAAWRGPDTRPLFYDSSYLGDPVRAVSVRRLVIEQEINGWTTITAWQRINERQALTLSLFGRSLGRLALLIISAGVIVWVALAYGLRPLQRLRHSIARRSPDDLTPIATAVPLELESVVASMNHLFGQVAGANQVRERFIADAAHQLRNPVAAIRTQSEMALQSRDLDAYRGSVSRILDTVDNTGRVVEQLLVSARAHAQDPAQAETFELNQVVREAAEAHAIRALETNHEFAFEAIDETYRLSGYPRLFGEAVSNLIDNAIRHTPPGTQIEVGLENGREDATVRVYVADDGPELSADEFRRLLQPFATGRADTRGSGLGLSVVDDIARMHGGRLSIGPWRRGQGKQLSITLPASTG